MKPIGKVLRPLRLILVLPVIFLACTKIERPAPVVAPDPFSEPLAPQTLQSDESGMVRISVDLLGIDRTKPFGFSSRGFQYGRFRVMGDTALRFVPDVADNWKADSGILRVTQGDRFKEGFLKIINRAFQPSTPVIQWLKGTPIPPMTPLQLEPFDVRQIENIPGLEETGSFIDSIWGFVYSAERSPDNRKINYQATGGIGMFLNFGSDQIYYRVKRPNGLFFRGWIPIRIGDQSPPNAQNDLRNLPPSGGFIPWTDLAANDQGSGGILPRNPYRLRLEPLTYTGNRRVNTPLGQINDSTINGAPGFYYRWNPGSLLADTVYLYLEEGPDVRITRSILIVQPQ